MSQPPFDSSDAAIAIEIVREASLLARRIQAEMIAGSLTKSDRSPVTVADFAVQALVARRLAEAFPGVSLVGEEQADALLLDEGVAILDQVTGFVRSAIPDATPEEVCGLIERGSGEPAGTFWTLDPIDGTKGFLRREQYAVALALVRNGEVALGVLACPELSTEFGSDFSPAVSKERGMIIAAVRNQGTWAQPMRPGTQWQRFTVSSCSDAASARLLRSVEKTHTNTDEIGQLVAKLGIAAPPIAMDSQAKYAVLAAGAGDVLVRLLSRSRPDYREKIWDQAAGAIIVTEAGGRITDLNGKPLDFSQGRTLAQNRGILATNGLVHDVFLSSLRELST